MISAINLPVVLLITILRVSQYAEEKSNLSDCLVGIIQHLRGRVMKISVLTSFQDASVLTQILRQIDVPVVINCPEHSKNDGLEKRVRSDLVIIMEENLEVTPILNRVLWHADTIFLIVCDAASTADHFHVFWKHKVINVFALTEDDEGVTLRSFLPYEKNSCENGKSKELDKWRDGNFLNDGFSKINEKIRIKNMNGCPVNVSVVNVKPVIIFPKDCFCNSSKIVNGIEAKLLDMIAEKLKFTPTYSVAKDGIGWGWIKPPRGVVGEVYTGVSDFGFGLLAPILERYENLHLSNPYDETECITFSVPAGAGLGNALWLHILAAQLSFMQWGLIILSLILTIVIYWLGSNLSLVETIFYIYSTFLGQTVKLPSRLTLKLLLSFWIWFSLGITSIYDASVGSQIIVPLKHSEIETFKDLLHSNLKLTGYPNMLKVIHMNKDDPIFEDIGNRFVPTEFDIDEAVDIMTGKREIAYLAHMSTFTYSALENPNAKGNILPLKQCAYKYYPTLAMKKYSPFSRAVDNIILKVAESGLINYWKSRLLYKVPPLPSHFEHFRLKQTLGIFALYFLGHLIALTAFIAEIMFNCKKAARKNVLMRKTLK